jgi:hypothetical protein
MKLNSTQIERTLNQFNARVIAEDNPTIAELNDLFGDHTFFLDARGLNVLELIELPRMEPESGEMINLADWSDATLTKLRTTDVVVPRSRIAFDERYSRLTQGDAAFSTRVLNGECVPMSLVARCKSGGRRWRADYSASGLQRSSGFVVTV